jgi:hypothetical protein
MMNPREYDPREYDPRRDSQMPGAEREKCHVAYFIGGPWDLTKRVLQAPACSVFVVAGEHEYRGQWENHGLSTPAIAERHHYVLRDALLDYGRTRVAIYLYQGKE